LETCGEVFTENGGRELRWENRAGARPGLSSRERQGLTDGAREEGATSIGKRSSIAGVTLSVTCRQHSETEVSDLSKPSDVMGKFLSDTQYVLGNKMSESDIVEDIQVLWVEDIHVL